MLPVLSPFDPFSTCENKVSKMQIFDQFPCLQLFESSSLLPDNVELKTWLATSFVPWPLLTHHPHSSPSSFLRCTPLIIFPKHSFSSTLPSSFYNNLIFYSFKPVLPLPLKTLHGFSNMGGVFVLRVLIAACSCFIILVYLFIWTPAIL